MDHVEWAGIPSLTRFKASEAATRIALCAWWDLQPRSLATGEPFDRAQLSNLLIGRSTAADAVRQTIKPGALPERYRAWSANRILLPTEDILLNELEMVLAEPPLTMDPRTWDLTLRSHCISDEAARSLAKSDNLGFLEIRHEALIRSLREFLTEVCEWGLEDTPPLDEFLIEDLDEDSNAG